MTTGITVLTLPRSGSSLVANIMKHLGVFMGENLQPPDFLNEKGYFEDMDWHAIIKPVVGYQYVTRRVTALSLPTKTRIGGLINQRNRDHNLWGFKNPKSVFLIQHVWPIMKELGTNILVVNCERDYDAVIRSFHNHSQLAYGGTRKKSEEEIRNILDNWKSEKQKRLNEFRSEYGNDIYTISFEGLISNPEKEILNLESFIRKDLNPSAPHQINAAINVIDPELKHQ